MNIAIITGRLGKDPELQQTTSGKAVCNVSIAIEDYKKGDDAPANWQNIRVWGDRAEYLCQNVGKGDKIVIQGAIKNESYEKDGVTHYKNVIDVSSWEFANRSKTSSKPQATDSVVIKEMTQEDYQTDTDLPF